MRRPLGRPPKIDAAAIVDAALVVGLDRLTMEAVARRLSVSATARYHHFPPRDALALVAMERRRLPLPATKLTGPE